MSDIDLRCIDALELVRGIPCASVGMVHADPPWKYSGTDTARGHAGAYYEGLPESVIAEHLAATFDVVAPNGYLVVWCTFPKLLEWARKDDILRKVGWHYVSGACWGKTNGLGVGYHLRGDSEPVLFYKKGAMLPLTTQSNLWLDRRIGHSEKPQEALRALVRMAVPPDGLVLDLYAGASASMARACRATGRRYLGAEIDPQRHAEALRRLALEEQAVMELEAIA